MFEIKILKAFENKEKKREIAELMRSFLKKNKENTKDAWVLKFENREDFLRAVVLISSKISEIKAADVIYDYCISQQMNNETCKRFIEAFFLYHADLFQYVVNITVMNLDLYFTTNDVLNIESFLLFNMNSLKKELENKLSDPETLDSIVGLMESLVLDKISVLQALAEAKQVLEEGNIKIEPIKDFKIYNSGDKIKCITDKKKEIDRVFLDEKYGIYLDEDFGDVEVIVILIGLIVPERVILFASLPDEEKESIKELISTFGPIVGDVKILNAEEMIPR